MTVKRVSDRLEVVMKATHMDSVTEFNLRRMRSMTKEFKSSWTRCVATVGLPVNDAESISVFFDILEEDGICKAMLFICKRQEFVGGKGDVDVEIAHGPSGKLVRVTAKDGTGRSRYGVMAGHHTDDMYELIDELRSLL
jgi:hypothetical protein